MSSPKLDRQLDTLFYEALRPEAKAEAPPDAWDRVARRLGPATSPEAGIVERLLLGLERPLLALTQRIPVWHTAKWHTPVWGRIGSFLHSFHTLYPPSTAELVSRDCDVGYRPSSFIGVAAKQVLDLRLAS